MILSRLWYARLYYIALVVVVSFEELLNAVTAQLGLTLAHSLCILPLLVVDMVGVKVINMDIWYVRRLHSARGQRIPVKVSEPRMLLELFDSFCVANTLRRSSLQALVNKISGLLVPAIGDCIFLDLDLTNENLIANIFSSPALVGSLTHHALVGDNTNGEIIGSKTMVLAAHDLRRHVAWCSTRFARIVWG